MDGLLLGFRQVTVQFQSIASGFSYSHPVLVSMISVCVSSTSNVVSCVALKPSVYSILRVLTAKTAFFTQCICFARVTCINPLNPELNPICYLLALLAHHFLHVSRIRVKSLTLRLLMSYICMERVFLMFLDHTQRRSTVGRTPLDE